MAIDASIHERVMSLSTEDRALLADALLQSLQEEPLSECDQAWIVEAEDRLAAYKRGELGSISFEESMRRVGLG